MAKSVYFPLNYDLTSYFLKSEVSRSILGTDVYKRILNYDYKLVLAMVRTLLKVKIPCTVEPTIEYGRKNAMMRVGKYLIVLLLQ